MLDALAHQQFDSTVKQVRVLASARVAKRLAGWIDLERVLAEAIDIAEEKAKG